MKKHMKSASFLFLSLQIIFNTKAQTISEFEGDVSITTPTPSITLVDEQGMKGRIYESNDDIFLISEQRHVRIGASGIIELNASQVEIDPTISDDAILSSDLNQTAGDLFLVSNDAVIAQINKNLNTQGNFFVWDGNSTNLFQVTYNGNVYAQGSLYNGSDRNRKEDIQAISPDSLLSSLEKLPLYRWKYKGEDRHHIGPIAQDFYRVFGLGNETSIATIDADGIALAGIQAQQSLIDRQASEINSLKKQLRDLTTEMAELKNLFSTFVSKADQ